ncbi:hypothetical protein HanXRQr2_Chr11g0474311 [Helianthus annuus]|uniref:Uncharacterized protein n=1 Tax=Helianthus annuus TaxID=4232 RepID=A0A9K3MYM6_HELAN|nr:hypothetical protein HanXRQr2_Chr11g0474311 [Helianthus annuus]KAJ0873859.1 hypothetical protein HanPSC8_Chr11g0457331 [Helianthus annuus]
MSPSRRLYMPKMSAQLSRHPQPISSENLIKEKEGPGSRHGHWTRYCRESSCH